MAKSPDQRSKTEQNNKVHTPVQDNGKVPTPTYNDKTIDYGDKIQDF